MSVKDWIILALLCLAALIWWVRSRRERIVGRSPGRSHTKVVALLEEEGYEVLGARPRLTVQMEIDGTTYPFDLSCDLLAKKHGLLFLVKVRRDAGKGRLQSKQWRSSLLRDVLAFRTNGIVVVNPEKEKLQEVRFRM
ncbi:MAG: hypothetical protein GX167_07090 [Firmicutes bacterium]|nr:hypothetical protein [Bacillota bacterium]